MRSFKPAVLLGIAAVALTSPATPSWAADAIAASAGELEEVVVTAEKREANLQKTSISIQVYKGEELAKQGKKRLDEIMNGVVGVQSRDSQVGNVFFMRGVDAGGGSGAPTAGANTVAVLIDGVYQARGETVRGGTLDLGQVEVMRGTQSSSLGANALAGAVSLVTNKPVFQYAATGSVEVGNYNLQNVDGVLNVPLSGNQAVRVAFSKNKRNGYLSSGAGDSDLTIARMKYRWKASDNVDLVVTASHQNIGGNGVIQGVLTRSGTWAPYSATTPNCTAVITTACRLTIMGYPPIFQLQPGPVFSDRANPWNDGYPKDQWPNSPFRDTNINDYTAELNWNTRIGTVTFLPSYEAAHFRSQEPPRGTGTSYMAEDRVQTTKQVDLRLASNPGGKVQWLAGAYYYDSNFSGSFLSVSLPNDAMNVPGATVTNNTCGYTAATLTSCNTWTYDQLSGLKTSSLYGDQTFSATDKLRLKAGLRYSRDKKAADYSVGPNSAVLDANGVPTGAYIGGTTAPIYNQLASGMGASNLTAFSGFNFRHFDHTWSNVAYSTGVEYDVMPSAMVYATYKTGYQAGAISTMGGVGTFTTANTSQQATVGFKSRWLDNRLQFNVEAFDMNFKDRPFALTQLNAINAALPQALCNTAGAVFTAPFVASNFACLTPNGNGVVDNKSSGVDFEVSFVPTAADRLDLSVETLKSAYKSTPTVPLYTLAIINQAAVANGAAAANDALAQILLDRYNLLRDSYNGLTLQNAPKWSGNMTYAHKFSLPGGSTLTPSINGVYKTAYWTQGGAPVVAGQDIRTALSPGSLVRQDGYTMWNAFVAWDSGDGKFGVNAFIRNIQNKPIMLNIGGEPGSTITYISLDAPRTYGFRFSANF